MKILFIQKDVFAKPAVMALSALLKRDGHVTALCIDDLETDPGYKISVFKPDIIGFSITTGEYPWMKQIAERIRPYFKGLIICGGAHPTFYPDVIYDENIDAVCVGEGDQALSEFVAEYEKNGDITSVKNFLVKKDGQVFRNELRNLVEDLDSLPFYDRSVYKAYSLYDEKKNDVLYHTVMITGRGCPFKCAFCFNKAYNELYQGKGQIVRRRSVTNVIEELGALKKNESPEFITFDDDTFTLASDIWLDDFLQAYKREINIPFKLNARASHLNETRIIKLKKAGCFAVKIGVESGNSALRNNLLGKDISQDDIIAAAFLLKKHRIRFQTFNMVGSPGETFDMAMETYRLNKKIRPDFVWCSLVNPYPGTDIYAYSIKNGFIQKTDASGSSYSYFGNTPIKMMDRRKMIHLQKLLFFGVFFKIPDRLIIFLAGLPLTGLYNTVFGSGMFIGLNRINKINFLKTLKITIRYLVKYNFEK